VHAGCSLGARKREVAFRSEADAGAAQFSSDPGVCTVSLALVSGPALIAGQWISPTAF